MSLTSQSNDFDDRNDRRLIVKIWFDTYGQFLRKSKKVQKRFIGHFGLILAIFLRSQTYDFVHAGAPSIVKRLCQNFFKILEAVLKKIEVFT